MRVYLLFFAAELFCVTKTAAGCSLLSISVLSISVSSRSIPKRLPRLSTFIITLALPCANTIKSGGNVFTHREAILQNLLRKYSLENNRMMPELNAISNWFQIVLLNVDKIHSTAGTNDENVLRSTPNGGILTVLFHV